MGVDDCPAVPDKALERIVVRDWTAGGEVIERDGDDGAPGKGARWIDV